MHPARNTIAVLAVTQILSWGSLYYAIAVLAPVVSGAIRSGAIRTE